jgi:hypothetical protein
MFLNSWCSKCETKLHTQTHACTHTHKRHVECTNVNKFFDLHFAFVRHFPLIIITSLLNCILTHVLGYVVFSLKTQCSVADAMVLSCFCLSFYSPLPPAQTRVLGWYCQVFFVMPSILQHMSISIHPFCFVLKGEKPRWNGDNSIVSFLNRFQVCFQQIFIKQCF